MWIAKISGASTLSKKAFPYKDVWDALRCIFDAFGMDLCMWGTDWARAVAFLTYKEVSLRSGSLFASATASARR